MSREHGRRVASAVLIGREVELAELEAARAQAANGEPRFVLIRGEAGIGKTRLLDEALRRAADAGSLALRGATVPLGGLGAPFGPMVQAMRDTAQAGIGSRAVALIDAARKALRGEAESGSESGPSDVEPFERLLDVVDVLSGDGSSAPLVLAIEDLH